MGIDPIFVQTDFDSGTFPAAGKRQHVVPVSAERKDLRGHIRCCIFVGAYIAQAVVPVCAGDEGKAKILVALFGNIDLVPGGADAVVAHFLQTGAVFKGADIHGPHGLGHFQGAQLGAAGEGVCSDAGDPLGNSQFRQGGAVTEGVRSDDSDSRGNGQPGQSGTAGESRLPDGIDALRQGDRRQGLTVGEGLLPDGGDAGGDRELRQVSAVVERPAGDLSEAGGQTRLGHRAAGKGGRTQRCDRVGQRELHQAGTLKGALADGGKAAWEGQAVQVGAIVKCLVSHGFHTAGHQKVKKVSAFIERPFPHGGDGLSHGHRLQLIAPREQLRRDAVQGRRQRDRFQPIAV